MRQFEMKAQARTTAGSRAARKMRREGHIPGVLCGHGVESRSVSVSAKDFDDARKKHARIIMLQLDGASEPAIIHEIDWDVVTQEPLHVDFQRVNMKEKIVVEVPIKAKGPSKGEAEGGIFVLQMGQVKVRCFPLDIPDSIEVDIRPLLIHESIKVKDLVLPANIEPADAPESLVLSIVEPKKEELPVPGAAAEAAGAAEPELIAKAPKEGEEAEGATPDAAAAAAKGGAAAKAVPAAKAPAKEKKPEKN
jgi:large subunit ribosomal protein L25